MRIGHLLGIGIMGAVIPLASCRATQLDLTRTEAYTFFVVGTRLRVSVPLGYGSLNSSPETIDELRELKTGAGTSLLTVDYDQPERYRVGALNVEASVSRHDDEALRIVDGDQRFLAQYRINLSKSRKLCSAPGAVCPESIADPERVAIDGTQWWLIKFVDRNGSLHRVYFLDTDKGYYVRLNVGMNGTRVKDGHWLSMAEAATKHILRSVSISTVQ